MVKTKRRKLKSLGENITVSKSTFAAEEDCFELQSWSDIPCELLELIVSRLTLEENIRMSAVCKRWNSVAVRMRAVGKCPLIMYFPKDGGRYEFYDPTLRRTYCMEMPDLSGANICYTKDGWLLMYRPITCRVFFFNPFTRELIKLPRFELSHQIAAFSFAPSSQSCVVFTVKHISPTVVAISTCYPGAADWTTANYPNRLPFVCSIWNKIVFCSGLFYCLSLTGWLGVFDPQECTWTVLVVPPPRHTDNCFSQSWWKGKFMTEYEGEILAIYTCCGKNPMIFKLDEINMAWYEMKTLDGLTLFASYLSSHSRSNITGIMRNSIYFSKVRFYGKRCISYSIDDCRYYPSKQSHDWGKIDRFESIWVEPPQDLLPFP